MIPNLTLERALANYTNNPTQVNAKQLHDLLVSSSFVVLMHPDRVHPNVPAEIAQLSTLLQKGISEKLPVLLMRSTAKQSPNIMLPVFTSKEEADQWEGSSNCLGLQITFLALYRLLQQRQDEIEYLAMNIGSDSVVFKVKDFLNAFVEIHSINTHEEEFKPGEILRLENAGPILSRESLQTLNRSARQFQDITRIWVARQIKDGEFYRYLIIVESPNTREERYQDLVVPFLQKEKKNGALVMADSDAARDVVAQFEPVYIKQ